MTSLRFLSLSAGLVLGILSLRAAEPAPAAAGKEALQAYFDGSFPAEITRVNVGEDRVDISGRTGRAEGAVFLACIPMHAVLGAEEAAAELFPLAPDADGSFSVSLPRRADGTDRLSARWRIFSKTPRGAEALSRARYADETSCRAPELPAAKPRSKKGLGGWLPAPLPGELAELGISAVTVNVMLHPLISLSPEPGTFPIRWQGRTYHAREQALAGLDSVFLAAQEQGAMVSAILLVANPAKKEDPVVKLLGHPDAEPQGIYAMPNLTSEEGLALYGAILNLMAERWSRADGKHGRVHHWILHNEVDAGRVWTNAGRKEDIAYMDLYQRSMRLMHLIARQYDPHARAFISLTHHWAEKGQADWYGSRRMLELLAAFCRAEGDFPWGLAFHPYPQDLGNPRTWEDGQASFGFGTEKITPRNLEVLDAWMKRPEMRYRGEVRPVHLSENGFNSPDYSEKALAEQAAGMALAWKKIAGLSSIECWHYHNRIDHRGEGGLRIGLRKFPDEPGDPLGKKPVWHLYKALGTAEEGKAAARYLPVIGIAVWDEVPHRGEIR